ncbi:MAG: Dabb family protein [Spirochaetes bacterium]|nr:Dabb family protein [Spirochaetota bacterium]
MFVHTVFFWLKKDITAENRALFERELKTLTAIPSAKSGFCGKPAATDRPVVDRSYDYGLTVMFDGLAGHDAYQIDPLHKKFLNDCSGFWTKVLVYDYE